MAKLLDPDGFMASPEASVVALLHRTVVAKSNAEYQAGPACDLRGGEALHTARCYRYSNCFTGASPSPPSKQSLPSRCVHGSKNLKSALPRNGLGWGEYPCGSSLFLPDGTGTGRFTVRGYGGAVDVVSMYRLTLDTAPYPPMGAGRELR
ncbi:hypothetical protein PoMZ_10618, partial [Pyricularia oryzae]